MLVIPLSNRHDREAFDCGNSDLNRWFREVASQHKRKLVSGTFVVTESALATEVLGFYAISLLELLNDELPTALKKRLPQRVPAFRLGRLAVSVSHRGKRIGEHLLFDAIDRATRVSQEIGGVGVVVDAKDSAVEFYRRYGFAVMPDHPNKLFLAIQPG